MPLPKQQASKPAIEAGQKNTTNNSQTSADNDSDTLQISPLPEVKLSAGDYINNAILFLQTGDEVNARRALNNALEVDPQNARANLLLKQIVTTAEEYFNEPDSFTYATKHGETFSIIAEKYLKDPLKFYILAKYNKFTKPNELIEGVQLQIPGDDPDEVKPVITRKPEAPPKKPTQKNDTEIDVALGLATQYNDSGKYQNAIDLLDELLIKYHNNQKLRDALVVTYTRYAKVLAEKAELLEAQSILEKAVSMQPANSELKKQLTTVRNKREADRFFQLGVGQLNNGEEDTALKSFTKTLALDPNHKQARSKIVAIKSDVIEQQHKKAMTLYRKQQLKPAIKIWDDILAIDPSHELAKLYRSRAAELQKRIDKFD